MGSDPLSAELLEGGVVLLRDLFPKNSLANLTSAAGKCFEAIRVAEAPPERYQFNRFSHSALLHSLTDFGCTSEELLGPLSAPALKRLFTAALGKPWNCRMEHSWIRKKFSPKHVPDPHYQPHTWHQDGALGVQFPTEIGPPIPITELVTCWIPLTPCGLDSPGLEFVRCRQTALLHFTEIGDPLLRQRFLPTEFWAPILQLGDALVFLNTTLHRTHVRPEMRQDRLSLEYRVFSR